MVFWSALVEQIWAARTVVLVLAFVVTRLLVRFAPASLPRSHVRVAGVLIFGHVVAVVTAAGQLASGYDGQIAGVVALAFELLAYVSLAVTAIFRVVLPRAIGFVLPRILIDLVSGAGVVIVFVAVGNRAGFSVAGLITTSAVLTAVIGFSLQDTLGNVMGGLSLQLDKSVAVGDWISLGAGLPVGRVTEIRWRYTAIETRNWETVIIPNGALVKSQVTILGKRIGEPGQWRRTVEFFVDFRTPPPQVIEAVQEALRADPVPNVATSPAPLVLFMGVRDSFAVYAVRYWLTDLLYDDGTDSAVRIRMWFALRRADIPLSIPATAVFVTHETPARDQRKADEELARRLAALASVDLFRGLGEELRRELAGQLVYTPFHAGESITREGDRDDGLYMIVSGTAAVRIRAADGEEKEVARLIAGQFFGEMSLMTGEARTANVVAASELVCYRVDKPAFERILREQPSIAELIAEVLATRRTALTAARDERDEGRRKRMATAKQDLLGRIRGFFGIAN